MRSFHEGKYMLYIAFVLAAYHAVPLYAYSLGWFNMFLSQFLFPVVGDIFALGIAFSVRGHAGGLRLLRWIGRLFVTTGLLYLALLIGSLLVSQQTYAQWNIFVFLALPFAVPSFLLVGLLTGLIIRNPKNTV